jgi:hypothetical protein
MIKKLIAFVTRRPSFDVALGALQKTLDHLDAVVVHQDNLSVKHNRTIEKAVAAQEAADAESARAKRVSDRLATLLS